MHHTIAWRESIADIVANDITPVPDELMAINNGHFVPQTDKFILYAYAGAAGITDARFISPSLRQITNPRIRPINLAIVPVDEPNMADYTRNPLRVKGLEELQLEASQTTGGAAVVAAVAALANAAPSPAPQGNIYAMRGVGATTVGAGAWTGCPIAWADVLPTGNYSCVGGEFIGVTAIAGRFIFEEQWDRPGALGQSLISGAGPLVFRDGGLGVWGRFNANRMPTVQMLCNAADTVQTILLHFVRTG